MTESRLRTLVALAAAGSVRGAAARLTVTESAVSASIAALARELGVPLVEPAGRGLRLTPSGTVYARYARRVLGLLDEGAAAAAQELDPERGRLRLAAVTTAGEHLLPALLADFRRRHPRVALALDVAPSDQVWDLVTSHEADLVIAGRPPAHVEARVVATKANELVVVAAPAVAAAFDWTATPWLLREQGSGTRTAVEAYLNSQDVAPPQLVLGSNGAVIAGAVAELGASLVSRDAVLDQLSDGRLVEVPAPGTPMRRPWHAVAGAYSGAATWLFVRQLRAAGWRARSGAEPPGPPPEADPGRLTPHSLHLPGEVPRGAGRLRSPLAARTDRPQRTEGPMSEALHETARTMVNRPRGILAADESIGTMSKRLEKAGVPATAENRRAYRAMLMTTPDLQSGISGVILADETFNQHLDDGQPFPDAVTALGILPGIKVDTGAKALAGSPGETITEGLDGLRERLADYGERGARFAKWRAVIHIADELPTLRALRANAHALARYAALCQEAGIVPIVEPEVLMDGSHSMARCAAVTTSTLEHVVAELDEAGVDLAGIVLKPNMVVPGKESGEQASPEEIAEQTVAVLRAVLPESLAGVAFLSGGQAPQVATANLAAMQQHDTPWPLTFSFGRALVDPALAAWSVDPATRVAEGQQGLADRVAGNSAAVAGKEPASSTA